MLRCTYIKDQVGPIFVLLIFVDEQFQRLEQMMQKLSIEVKNNGQKIDLLLDQQGKEEYRYR